MNANPTMKSPRSTRKDTEENGNSIQKSGVILNGASAWAQVAGRCAVKDLVRCRTAIQASEL